MSRPQFKARLALPLALGLALSLVACHKQAAPTPGDDTGAAPQAAELPPIEIKDDTPNLLLTWIDDKGDFHVVEKPADVPKESKGSVRVVITTREDGTGKLVYVANMNEVTPTGSYRVKTMTRAAWDELGAGKRKARLEALAPSASPSSEPPGGAQPDGKSPTSPAGKAPVTGVVVIIYGADWCKPCHDAERYLKQRGATVIKKNIEDNEVAAEEMRKKLERAGRGGASIPVIDIMGQIQVGFSPAALEQALATARGSKGL